MVCNDSKRVWDFGYWLSRKYRGADSPKGDFFEDMLRDMYRQRPPFHQRYQPIVSWINSYKWIKNHLEELEACCAAMETFEELWKEYKSECPEGVKRIEERCSF